jgi:hypothetical protein
LSRDVFGVGQGFLVVLNYSNSICFDALLEDITK